MFLSSLQESCRSRFRLSSRLFGCLKCLLLLIFRHILEIINDHPSLVVKVAKSFAKIQNIVVQKANLDICCQLNS